jgi:hypothetical protein
MVYLKVLIRHSQEGTGENDGKTSVRRVAVSQFTRLVTGGPCSTLGQTMCDVWFDFSKYLSFPCQFSFNHMLYKSTEIPN